MVFASDLSGADFDFDGIDDLIIGSQPAFNTVDNEVVSDGGRVSIVYGNEPKTIFVHSNS